MGHLISEENVPWQHSLNFDRYMLNVYTINLYVAATLSISVKILQEQIFSTRENEFIMRPTVSMLFRLYIYLRQLGITSKTLGSYETKNI